MGFRGICCVLRCVLLLLQSSTACQKISGIRTWEVCYGLKDDKQRCCCREKLQEQVSRVTSPDTPVWPNSGGRMSSEG